MLFTSLSRTRICLPTALSLAQRQAGATVTKLRLPISNNNNNSILLRHQTFSTVALPRPPLFEWQTLLDNAIWWIKRTFQPSIIRKKRKTGFLVRQRTVGGRRVLKRRRNKGRKLLGGGI